MGKAGLRSIDAAAALVVTTLVAVGAWSALRQGPSNTQRIHAAQQSLTDTRAAQRAAQIAVDHLQADVTALEEDAKSRAMPVSDSAPEDNLHSVAMIARQSKFEMTSVVPSPPQNYPGLTELRYAIQGHGSYAAWRSFLHGFEQAPFWADITQIQMGAERGSSESDKAEHAVSFTLSLFVPQPIAPPPAGKGNTP